MSKTSRVWYFLWKGGTLPRAKMPLRKSHDRFQLYVFMHFPWFIKVEPKIFSYFSCLFFWLLIAFISFIDSLKQAGFLEYPNRYPDTIGCPNWYPVFSIDPWQSIDSWHALLLKKHIIFSARGSCHWHICSTEAMYVWSYIGAL